MYIYIYVNGAGNQTSHDFIPKGGRRYVSKDVASLARAVSASTAKPEPSPAQTVSSLAGRGSDEAIKNRKVSQSLTAM